MPRPATAEKTALMKRLEDLILRAEEVTFIVPDDTGFFSIEDALVQRVRNLMREALEALRQATAVYDEEEPADAAPEQVDESEETLSDIGAAISTELAAQEVSNMAFAARAQLQENFEALEGALARGSVWGVASHADTGLRRAAKGLITVEAAIREYEGLESVERRWIDLEDALEIRRLYGQFRRAIVRLDQPDTRSDLEQRLRSAALRIAILRDRKIYPFLRVYDRVPLRRLQKRILRWLEREDDGEKTREGEQLWSDLVSFAELLAQINSREELREHDRRLLMRLKRLFFESKQPPKQLLPAHLAELERLLGRDDSLDRVVLSPLDHTIDDLEQPIERVLEELNRPYVPTAPHPLA